METGSKTVTPPTGFVLETNVGREPLTLPEGFVLEDRGSSGGPMSNLITGQKPRFDPMHPIASMQAMWESPAAMSNRETLTNPSRWPAAISQAGRDLAALADPNSEVSQAMGRKLEKIRAPGYWKTPEGQRDIEDALNIALVLNTVTPTLKRPPLVPKQPIKEAFETVSAKPTSGQLARDPDLMRFELEQAKRSVPEVEPLRRTFESQNSTLMDRGRELAANTGGIAENTAAAGKSVVAALEKKQAGMQAAARKAYQELSDQDVVMVSGLRKWFDGHKAEIAGNDNLKRVRNSFNELLKGRRVDAMTNGELERFKQIASNTLYKIDDRAGKMYSRQLTDLVDDARLATGTSDAFREARFMKTLERSEFADQGIIARLLRKTSNTDRAIGYEDVWKTAVKNSDINELKQVKNTLITGKGDQAWNDLRLETMRYLLQKGVSRNAMTPGMEEVFSGANFSNALRDIGSDKLKVLFTGQELKMLNAMADVGRYRLPPTLSPAGTNINYSNTGSFVADMLDRIGNLPGVRFAGGGLLSKMAGGAREGAERQATKRGVYYATHPEKFFDKGLKELVIPSYQSGGARAGIAAGTQLQERKK